jgi:hypothetical protein
LRINIRPLQRNKHMGAATPTTTISTSVARRRYAKARRVVVGRAKAEWITLVDRIATDVGVAVPVCRENERVAGSSKVRGHEPSER